MDRYPLTPTAARCPVCASRTAVRLISVTAAEAAQHHVLREADPVRHRELSAHVEELWGQPACDVVRCTECGFGFAWPYVAGDARFYALASGRPSYPSWRWEFGRTLQELRERVRRGELRGFTLLEVGAGAGAFVRCVVPELTPGDNVVCTELSGPGRAEIERYGIRCLSEEVHHLSTAEHGGRFDVLCLFQVLEHLDRLDELFALLGGMSTSRAHLFISVPNDARTTFNELHGSLLDMPPNHIGRWNRNSFEVMARRHGWRVAGHEVEPDAPRAKLVEHAAFRYMRRRQSPGTWANRIERMAPSPLRRALQGAAAAAYLLGSPGALSARLRSAGLGSAQWVHLEKMPAPGS